MLVFTVFIILFMNGSCVNCERSVDGNTTISTTERSIYYIHPAVYITHLKSNIKYNIMCANSCVIPFHVGDILELKCLQFDREATWFENRFIINPDKKKNETVLRIRPDGEDEAIVLNCTAKRSDHLNNILSRLFNVTFISAGADIKVTLKPRTKLTSENVTMLNTNYIRKGQHWKFRARCLYGIIMYPTISKNGRLSYKKRTMAEREFYKDGVIFINFDENMNGTIFYCVSYLIKTDNLTNTTVYERFKEKLSFRLVDDSTGSTRTKLNNSRENKQMPITTPTPTSEIFNTSIQSQDRNNDGAYYDDNKCGDNALKQSTIITILASLLAVAVLTIVGLIVYRCKYPHNAIEPGPAVPSEPEGPVYEAYNYSASTEVVLSRHLENIAPDSERVYDVVYQSRIQQHGSAEVPGRWPPLHHKTNKLNQ